MKKTKKITLLFLLIFVSSTVLDAQKTDIEQYFPDITVLKLNSPSPGYIFMSSKEVVPPLSSLFIGIFDNYGTPVFFRKISTKLGGIQLHGKDSVAFMAGIPRALNILDTLLNVDTVLSTDGYTLDPHDWDIDKNRHTIFIARDYRTVDMSVIVEGGNPAAEVKDFIVQEFDENHNLILTWNSADYFEITDADSPLVDFTAETIDYVHGNAVAFDSDTSFLISCRHMNEITKIDRRTGDIIWRLNGKNNEFTFINDDLRFSHQHSIKKLKNGNILLFDNGNTHEDTISSVVEYELDEVNKTATLVNRFYENPVLYADHGGTTQRLENGNTLAMWTKLNPSLTEFNPDGSIALEWDYSTQMFCPKVLKYKWQTSVFKTNTDTLDFGMWSGSGTDEQIVDITNNTTDTLYINNFTNHTAYFSITSPLPLKINPLETAQLTVGFDPTTAQTGYLQDLITICSDTENQRIARQINLFGQIADNNSPFAEIIPTSDNIARDTFVTVTFNEPVRLINGNELDYQNVSNYFIFKEVDNSGQNVAFTATINSEKNIIKLFPVDSLKSGLTYYVSFSSDISDYSDNPVIVSSGTFKTEGENINIQDIRKNINVYPNPVNNFLYITGADNESNLSITSIEGKEIYKSVNNKLNKLKINLTDLKSGIYFLKIQNNKKETIYFKKLIKIN